MVFTASEPDSMFPEEAVWRRSVLEVEDVEVVTADEATALLDGSADLW